VYTTSDAQGLIKKAQINQRGPISITELFQFKITRTTPIQVEVTDSSGEKKVFLLFTRISLERKWVDPIDSGKTDPTVAVVKPVTPGPKNPPVDPIANKLPGNDKDKDTSIPKTDTTGPTKPKNAPITEPNAKPDIIDQPPKNPVPLSEEDQTKNDIKILFNIADKN
jgi:hypothetical protein